MWVILNLDNKVLGLANIYSLNDIDVRAKLLDWFTKYLPEVDWLLCVDFNIVDSHGDKLGTNHDIHFAKRS
jgi:hypothetical protein